MLQRAREYASADDFCRIFEKEMTSLYWLALALTADEAKAEQCLVTGLEECLSGNAVFKDWAHNWSKRVVIKKAIQLISPTAGTTYPIPAICTETEQDLEARAKSLLGGFKRLQAFDRFVFVMSVFESYADRECSALLGCPVAEVVKARVRVLEKIQVPLLQESAV